jgi:hypothetical protein
MAVLASAAACVTAPITVATAVAAPGISAVAQALPFRPLQFNINGFNWGGYAASGSGFTSVSATWAEPSATCNSTNDLYAPWVGIDGYGSNTVEQTGVATSCSSGSPVYQAWYEMYPKAPVYLNLGSYPVSAGNVFHASVTYAGSRKYTLTMNNATRGWTFTTTQSISASRVSAEVIIESPTGAYPNFGTVSFSSCMVNGKSLGSFGPVALDPSSGGIFEATTSALGGGGTSFSDKYLHQ